MMKKLSLRSRRQVLISTTVLAGLLTGFRVASTRSTPLDINQSDSILAVADRAFSHFANGIDSGNFQPFLEMLSEDCTVRLPIAQFRTQGSSKDAIAAFLRYLYQQPTQARVIPINVIDNMNTVGYEFRLQGRRNDQPLDTQNTVFFDIKDDKIVGFREYVGN